MAEWTNAFDSKSKVPQNGIGGSNPSFSAKWLGVITGRKVAFVEI